MKHSLGETERHSLGPDTFQGYGARVSAVTLEGPQGAKRLKAGEAVDGVSTRVSSRSAQREYADFWSGGLSVD